MKALRYLLIAVAAVILLVAAAIVIATLVIDPNNYKPQIEKVVEDKTNLDLILEGDISWSFIPIGLELNNVEARLEDKPFVKLNQLVAEVDFWSLITMSPAVDQFTLDGLDANLVKNAQGQGNWERIMPEGEPSQAPAEQQPQEPARETATTEETGESEPLQFEVEEISITNAALHYTDEATGQSVTIEDVSVSATEIALGQTFPLQASFRFATNQPEFAVSAQLSAQMTANEALNQFQIQDLDSSFDMTGEPFGGQTVNAGLGGNITANLEAETASLSDIVASFANVELTTNLEVQGFSEPKLAGQLNVAEFSPRELLKAMGQADIVTSDENVLQSASFSTEIGGEPGQVALNNMNLSLDDTTFTGRFGLGLENTAISLNLQGNELNVDRYLPPKAEGEQATEPAADSAGESEGGTATASNAAESEGELLPLETLRDLALDINFGLGELVVSNLTITDIKSKITANNGLVKVEQFGGNLYEGDFNVTATLDARKDNPTWKISERANNIQTLSLLTDLADMTMLAGGANLTADITTQGNRMSALKSNAQGEVRFNLEKGSFNKMNLTRMACQGIALANQENLTATDWSDSTPFNDMHGVLKIDGNTINNTDLTAALAGMRLEGNGTVNTASNELDYELGLRIVGEIHRDEACRVTEYVKGAVIPVECRGDLTGEPAKLCSFDGSRFRDTLKTMAANAASEKAKKELNRAIDDKLGEKLEEKLDKESSGKIKDALKGLFNQ
ncbi:AsmA family protein [Marinobacter nanhaiticus D15-8W]|uniref:AsmA family protein n=1 Tax=Marinobacter nanhaiticus D15-8W TaxID=626887 RepID=N6WX81_9GAMM|nr:AsmA family protein [Marinobacter nanhaiticus]ENO16201.1 AsmA family protein [Marinobacter nanhaiticus D15-8W]BES72943.1 AsmA family protein [Marinobacter nanhaiticus D15-8W]